MSTTTVSKTEVPAGVWSIDPVHSLVEFKVGYLGISSVKGRFGGFSGALTSEDGELRLAGEIDLASVTTGDADRDAHLASPEFFDLERYPKATFASSEVAQEDGVVRVRGDLTLKGTTREVELVGAVRGPAEDPWGNARVAVELEGAIDRREFGVGWNAPLPGGGFLVGERVELELVFSAVREV
jgi:polyisoprenoid-binding protein YceI